MTDSALLAEGHPVDNYVFVETINPYVQPVLTPYQNYVHTQGTVMLCMNNYANRAFFFLDDQSGYIGRT